MRFYRKHTRLVITPTGPLHIGHALVAWMNKVLAVGSGGTFAIRFESVLAAHSLAAFRYGREDQARQNLAELEALDLGPSSPQTFAAQGFWPGTGVCTQEQYGMTDCFYREWGLEEIYGPWPPPYPEGAVRNFEAVYLTGPGNGALGEHPYIILNRVVEDWRTGRNVILRGNDLRSELSQYIAFAYRLCRDRRKLPELYFLPEICREREDGERFRLSASSGADVNGRMFIADYLVACRRKCPKRVKDPAAWTLGEARRLQRQLIGFFGRQLTKTGEWPGKLGAGGPEIIVNALQERPIIRDADWEAFLKEAR